MISLRLSSSERRAISERAPRDNAERANPDR
jgi:hypothetical protein